MWRGAAVALVLATGGLSYVVAFQTTEAVRFELGSMDWDYLEEPSNFHDRGRMEGPIRYEDGSVEVIEFYGRLTQERAGLTLPYHATRSPLRLYLRSHRFGLSGTVRLTVNGELVDEFVFTETS